MQVFANLCEPHSFMRAIMKNGETYSVGACNFFEGLSLNTPLLKKAFPNNPITIPITGHTLFAKLFIDYIQMHSGYQLSGDHRKFIEVLNVSGKLLFSLGFKANPYNTTDRQPLGLYTWNDDGSVKTSKFDSTGLYPLAVFQDYSIRRSDRAISFHYVNDPNTPANSKIEVYYGAELILNMTGAELGVRADNDPATLYLFRTTLNADSGSSYRHRLSYAIVTDTLNLSLEPLVMKPLALTYNVDFSGDVNALRENFQDETYLSCSAETGKYVEFTITKSATYFNQLATGGQLVSGAMFFYSRYLQIGGTSATFNISIYNGTELYYSEDYVLTANEDSAYYQTKVLAAIGTALAGLTTKQFQGFKVRITLKEV